MRYFGCTVVADHVHRKLAIRHKAALFLSATTRDKINLKCSSILEEHVIEKCTILVDDMAQHLGQSS